MLEQGDVSYCKFRASMSCHQNKFFALVLLMYFLLIWQISTLGTRARPWWDDEDESDVDDLFIIAGLLEGSRRNKRKKKFLHHFLVLVIFFIVFQLLFGLLSTWRSRFLSWREWGALLALGGWVIVLLFTSYREVDLSVLGWPLVALKRWFKLLSVPQCEPAMVSRFRGNKCSSMSQV